MFQEGKSFGAYPLLLVYLKMGTPKSGVPIQFTVSVGKKKFKSAVARNRVKRKVREAWRLNKHWLYDRIGNMGGQYAFMFIYIGKEDLPYAKIEKAMKNLNFRFSKKIIHLQPNGQGEPLS